MADLEAIEEAIGILTLDDSMREKLPHLDRVYEVAVKALKKQIPAKPAPYNGFAGKCVSCGVIFFDKSTAYCGNCGQALDWGKRYGIFTDNPR